MKTNTDQYLMRSIHEACGRAIQRATGGNALRSAALAALTANGSGGSATASRFSHVLSEALTERLRGVRSSKTLLPRRELERYLKKFARKEPEDRLLRSLASFHGYTLLAGYHVVRWKASVEELTDPDAHFHRADQLLQEYCGNDNLRLDTDLARLGHLWTEWRGLRSSAVSMYVGRLRIRFDLYRRILGKDVERAA